MEPTASPGTAIDVAKLVREHQVGLWRYLRALGCPSATAEDLVQETFLVVLQRPFQEYDQWATRAYLRRVAKNLLISHLRRTGREAQVAQLDQYEAQWQAWAGDDDGERALEALRECLGKLTDRVRWALELRFRQQWSRQQIAEALQMTEHGAKNLLQRAKQRLRACIEGKLS